MTKRHKIYFVPFYFGFLQPNKIVAKGERNTVRNVCDMRHLKCRISGNA